VVVPREGLETRPMLCTERGNVARNGAYLWWGGGGLQSGALFINLLLPVLTAALRCAGASTGSAALNLMRYTHHCVADATEAAEQCACASKSSNSA
jgi:hypothetical protein